jgi:hypothetical protein
MSEIEDLSINTFCGPLAGLVSPSDQLITLTYGQLQDLIQEAIERATTPLESRIESLERKVGSGEGGEDAPDSQKWHDNLLQIVLDLRANMALKGELEALEEITARERAYDRQRIAKLENPPEATETERERLARIEKYLRESPGHMISLAELRGKLGIGKQRLSMLLKKLDGDGYYLKKSTTDKRVRYLCLRPALNSSRRTITNFDV